MATFTVHYNLRKPVDNDNVDVESDLGSNFDTIDEELNRVADLADSHETTLTSKFKSAVKSSNQTVNNSTTFVDATDLAFTVEANKKYALDMFLLYDGLGTADIKFQLVIPSGDFWIAPGGLTASTVGGAGDIDLGVNLNNMSGGGLGARGTGDLNGTITRGVLAIGGTAGTVKLQFAQQAAVANNTILRANSWMMAYKLN